MVLPEVLKLQLAPFEPEIDRLLPPMLVLLLLLMVPDTVKVEPPLLDVEPLLEDDVDDVEPLLDVDPLLEDETVTATVSDIVLLSSLSTTLLPVKPVLLLPKDETIFCVPAPTAVTRPRAYVVSFESVTAVLET